MKNYWTWTTLYERTTLAIYEHYLCVAIKIAVCCSCVMMPVILLQVFDGRNAHTSIKFHKTSSMFINNCSRKSKSRGIKRKHGITVIWFSSPYSSVLRCTLQHHVFHFLIVKMLCYIWYEEFPFKLYSVIFTKLKNRHIRKFKFRFKLTTRRFHC